MKNKFKYIKYAITIIIFFIVVYTIDDNILMTVKNIINPIYFYLSLTIPLIIIPLIVNNRWKLFLQIQGIEERFLTLAKINFISIFLGFLLPSSTGFDAIRIYQIEKRHKNKLGAGGASVVIERLLGFYLLSLMGVAGALFAYTRGTEVGVLIFAIFINLFVSVVLLLFKNKKLYNRVSGIFLRVNKLKKTVNYLDKLYAAINSFPIDKTMFLTVPLILLFQLSSVLCAYLLFKAFGVDILFYYHLAFLPIILIISIIPISISGFGIREGGFVYFYGLIGVDGGIALLVSLLYYSVLVLVPAAIGMVLYLTGSTDIRKEKIRELTEKH
jgi:glycosyltransferase 2 family protein